MLINYLYLRGQEKKTFVKIAYPYQLYSSADILTSKNSVPSSWT